MTSDSDTQGKVDHSADVSEAFATLLKEEFLSDVTFKVGFVDFPAHRVVMAARSAYFKAMFSGNFSESTEKVVEIRKTSSAAFEQILKYFYTGQLSLSVIAIKDSVELIKLAHMYQMCGLQSEVTAYLKKSVRIENVCDLLIFTNHNTEILDELREHCLEFVDLEAAAVLKRKEFRRLPFKLFELVLQRDTLTAPEIDVFEAVNDWMEMNWLASKDDIKTALLKIIRLHLLNDVQLLTVVRNSELYSLEVLMDALASIKLKPLDYPEYRAPVPTENVATIKHGAEVIEGTVVPENGSLNVILDGNGDRTNFVRHVLGDGNGVTVKLARPFVISTISFWSFNSQNFSYSVETSSNGWRWTAVAGGSATPYFGHGSYETLVSFKRRPVVYFRIIGTAAVKNSANIFRASDCTSLDIFRVEAK